MRSLPQAQHGHVQQALKTLLITLALMLVLVGSILSLSAFTQAPSVNSQTSAGVGIVEHHKPFTQGCFPGNAVWTWSAPKLYQAWMTPGETYPTKHFNFHVQHYCGGDIANYHVMYIGNGLFQTYESVSGVTKNWGVAGWPVCYSLPQAAAGINGDAENKLPSPWGSQMGQQSYPPLWLSMDRLIGGNC